MNPQNNLATQAKNFIKKGENVYLKDFMFILELCIYSHKLMLEHHTDLDGKKEEDLRDILFNFVENNTGLFKLGRYIFNRECTEEHVIKGINNGHVDIKVSIPPPSEFCSGKHKAYIIECKRINGNKAKNRAYVEEGINRFIEGKYTSDMNVAGMIGFIESSKKRFKEDKISTIIKEINVILVDEFKRAQDETLQKISVFENSFKSTHNRKNKLGRIGIAHLMFDNISKN